MRSFRRFLEDNMAAPSASATPSSPDDPDQGTEDDTHVMDREMGISKKDSDAALTHGEMIMSNRPLTNLPGQRFLASAPIPVMVTKVYPDGSADVKVMFTLANRRKFKNLDGKTAYNGPVEDLPAHLSHAELSQLRVGAFKTGLGAASMGGMGSSLAGPPPGGPPGTSAI